MSKNKPVWEKQLNKSIRLIEYAEKPNLLNCVVKVGSRSFAFGSWGCDRERITSAAVKACCGAMFVQHANVSVTSFKSNLDWARGARPLEAD